MPEQCAKYPEDLSEADRAQYYAYVGYPKVQADILNSAHTPQAQNEEHHA